MATHVLVVDLNNFARYPSIAIGYLTAILRADGFQVDILAPLSTGLTGVPREPRPPWWGRLDQEFRYRTAVTRNRWVKAVRSRYATRHASKLARSKDAIVDEVASRLDAGVDVVLVSAYLMYHPHCVAIGDLCRERGVPMILGGPYFAAEEVAREWIDTLGLAALVGGESEPHLCDIVKRVAASKPICQTQGVWQNNGSLSLDAPPLVDLDSLPFPDYSNFPWAKYPNVIVPIIIGRGCGWGSCTFCSDITSTVGRTFRSRSPENVLAEIRHQHERHGAKLFVFTDLKLNSDLPVWHSLAERVQGIAQGARWIGSVHVDARGDDGLTLDELKQVRAAGMVRLTTGLESGSQRILDAMSKGTDLSVTSRFLRDAKEADISVRTTIITGYPGEEAADVDLTTAFLEQHMGCLERVFLNRFQIMSGTRIARQIAQKPEHYETITNLTVNHRQAQVQHHHTATEDPAYRRAISRLIRVVHRINRKPLSAAARDFEGVM